MSDDKNTTKKVIFQKQVQKEMTLIISNTEYTITPYLSVADVKHVLNKLKESKEIDYRLTLCELICIHIKDLNVNHILQIDDALLIEYIKNCVDENEVLSDSFNSIQAPNIFEKFIKAVKLTGEKYSKQIAESFKISLPKLVPEYNNVSKLLKDNISKSFTPLLNMSTQIETMMSSMRLNLAETLNNITKL